MQIYGLNGIGQVADIPGAVAGGQKFKMQKDAIDEQKKLENTTWLAGAAKYGLDNWGQPGILEQLVEEGKRRGIIDPQTQPQGITKEGLIKIYQGAKTALGGERFENLGPEQVPYAQRDTLTGEVSRGAGQVSQPKPPASMQEYQLAQQQGYKGSFLDFQREVNESRSGGRAQGGMSVEGTPGQKAVDTAFGKEYVEWTQGGASDVTRNLAQIGAVRDRLAAGEPLTGKGVGMTPGPIRAYINPEAQNALEQVEEVVQRNLRIILGAQFTEKEGERLIARAYNPRLDPQVNARRLTLLMTMMDQAIQQKTSAAKYYEQNGTLRGWEGQLPTVQDFEQALAQIDQEMGVGNSGNGQPGQGQQNPAASPQIVPGTTAINAQGDRIQWNGSQWIVIQ